MSPFAATAAATQHRPQHLGSTWVPQTLSPHPLSSIHGSASPSQHRLRCGQAAQQIAAAAVAVAAARARRRTTTTTRLSVSCALDQVATRSAPSYVSFVFCSCLSRCCCWPARLHARTLRTPHQVRARDVVRFQLAIATIFRAHMDALKKKEKRKKKVKARLQ